ncbi:phosphoribosyltransferase [Nakamurella antarctica]|uniref:Phosphoribosyltransferase n=2 Tax=Nakamurella antarctica TaxID=1902245 RepID=A0A3G8ZR95_9ACTN|nr:phosphoribosyltransferase [Nakamurella antarctica]
MFGVGLTTGDSQLGWALSDLVGLALRRNPRRAHLLVSSILGKHVPVDPDLVHGTGMLLGALVSYSLAGVELPEDVKTVAVEALSGAKPDGLVRLLERPAFDHPDVLVVGFAETATGLGHCVAQALGAGVYLHSTRRAVPGVQVVGTFQEGHSHATDHLLQPLPGTMLSPAGVMVLVDDEFSTGKTAMETIAEMHRLFPRPHYVVAALVDLRASSDQEAMASFATQLGIQIDVVAIVSGSVDLPLGLAAAAAAHIATAGVSIVRAGLLPVQQERARPYTELRLPWPATVPDGGRHGFLLTDREPFEIALEAASAILLQALSPHAHHVLVLGTEELMYLPMRLAGAISSTPGHICRFQTTTRSPIHVEDADGYPVRRGFAFESPEKDPAAHRYLYNADWDGAEADAIVLVIDEAMDTVDLRSEHGLLPVLESVGVPVVLAIVTGASPEALGQNRIAHS